MTLTKVDDSKNNLTESLLKSISEVMSSVVTMDIEQENFMELGCYLYRTTPAIMELQMAQNSPPNATEILQSLSTNIDCANDLVRKCSNGAKSIPDAKHNNIIKELKRVIENIGHDLSSIPSSTFENQEYAEIAIRSLSREMRNAGFHASGIQLSDMVETKLDNPYMEEREEGEERNPVPASKEESRTCSSDARSAEMPRLIDFLKGKYYGAHENSSQSFKTLPELAEYVDPLYDTFFCPLTKKIMEDPVTIESGITYERRAITEVFERFKDEPEATVCPTTGMKVQSRALNTNIALKTTIAEWKERNEATRIRVAHTALTMASSEGMVLDAISDMQLLCRKRTYNKVQMHNAGITKLLTRFLEHEDRKVRCEALNLLCLLAEDEEGKEIIGKTKAIATTIKMLSSNHPSESHASVSFLLELSKSELLYEKIGSLSGGILMLITMKYNESSDPSASKKAGEALKNLEMCQKNIKCMAENGHLEPLLNHLIDGSEEMQMEMVSYLGELVLGHDMKTYVAERASVALIKMVHNGNALTRKAAFKALVHISSHHPNNKTLIDAGVVSVMIEEIFKRRIYNEPMDSKEESTGILANILESGADPSTLQVNKHGHTMASDYIIYSIAHMLNYSMPNELNMNLIRILLSLTKLPKSFSTVVSVIKETEVSLTIIEFLNSLHEELIIASAELLIIVSSHMGHAIAEGLCKTREQPEGLIYKLETNRITKRHAMSANLLAKLPHQNLTLNLALLHRGTVPIVLQRVHEIQRGGVRTGRHARAYLEGLVGILVRFTATLYDHDVLLMAREQNLTLMFTELLARTAGSDEVQRLSAVGLERLSSQSLNLSRRPTESDRPKRRSRSLLLRCFILGPREERKPKLCPVHRGECSQSTTFCLLEARAVERLLGCLEHENGEVVEAALSAISTLLDEGVDVEGSVGMLSEVNVVGQVLRVLREHRSEGVQHKSFWVIERFLVGGGERSASYISSDKEFPSALVTAFHHGGSSTRQVAEKILRKLNRMPHFSRSFVV